MSSSRRQRAAAPAVADRAERECDGCALRRARWYCAADEAFLCHACDASVHSANPLAGRHERRRLRSPPPQPPPSWRRRKARTQRPHPAPSPRVPEADASGEDDGEAERPPCRVPVLADFRSPPLPGEADEELSEFAADMESLLAGGLGDDSFCIEALMGDETAKLELDEEMLSHVTAEKGTWRDTMDVYLDCGLPTNVEDVDEENIIARQPAAIGMNTSCGEEARAMLRLDYEAVIAAWSSSGSSPWTGGERPQFRLGGCWPEHSGVWGVVWEGDEGEEGAAADGDREARVTRYREKRRTRLFSNKIRYEVRKLNAEKRPRMKGRFVKQASFAIDTAY